MVKLSYVLTKDFVVCLPVRVLSYFKRMYLCGFVSLYVRMFVARANKVEGTMS